MAKILVIDDEPSITNLVSAYLKPEGYEVYAAADGNAGLKAARAFKPDLIILDVMLPGMDGIELLSRLRRESEVYICHHADRAHGRGRSRYLRQLPRDAGARTVQVDENPIELTAIEFDLLKALAENRGRVLTREQLLEKVWGGEYFGEMRVIDVHLGHVRQKLGRDDLIATVRGVGYRFEDEPL